MLFRVAGMSEKSMSNAYRLLAGRGSGSTKSRSPMKAARPGRPKKTKADPPASPVRRVRKPVARPRMVESESEEEKESDEEIPLAAALPPPPNRHLASLRPRQSSVPLQPQPPPAATKAGAEVRARASKEKTPDAVAEFRNRALAQKKENVKVEKLEKVVEQVQKKKVARPAFNQAINDCDQRLYAVDPSAKVVLPSVIPRALIPQAALLPPLFYEPLKVISPGVQTGTHPTMERRGVNRSILHSFSVDLEFPEATHVVLVRFARYAPMFTSPAVDVNPDNLQITCNGNIVLKVENVNYGIAADKPLVAAPIELKKEFLRSSTNLATGRPISVNLIVEYTVRQNDAEEDFIMHVELTRRRPTEELVREVQQPFQILSPDDDDGIMSGSSIVNLICPLSLKPLDIPVRGRECRHVECFSAASYLEANRFRKPKWTCPRCKISVPFEDLILDEFMTDVLAFTSKPTVDIVAEKDRLVVREKKVLKNMNTFVINDRPAAINRDHSIVILDD
ncbi:hypothetical protein RvY_00086-2 [Ramazzottius varieornatus]|uniref:SP-RING-type domain-containing protein n=1 Tax=Ramazzottius varieornatus TaxID=947166 RepID=A0A1D1ULI5_RAMVA|nr:hypothetical protein RvY_00086-2 [Ramazzottius varieornatus]